MSLINNALKRVSESGSKNSSKPLNYAQPIFRSNFHKRPTKLYILLGVILSGLALALIFIYLKKNPEKIPSSLAFLIKTNESVPTNTAKINAYEFSRTTIVAVAKMQSNNLREATENIPPNKTNVLASESSKSTTLTDAQKKEKQTTNLENKSNITSSSADIAKAAPSIESNKSELKPSIKTEPEKTIKPRIIPTKFPDLKLNGIFYQKTKPSAIINGKTVYIGEEINGVKVISIEPESVTVQFEDEKRILKM